MFWPWKATHIEVNNEFIASGISENQIATKFKVLELVDLKVVVQLHYNVVIDIK